MTQTLLSAAALAHREHRCPAPGHPSGASPPLRLGSERAAASHRCRPPLDAAFLIHGSAIKSRANLHCFNHMQISNRRLKGGLRIILCAVSGKIRRTSSLIASQLPAAEFLMTTVAWGTGRLVLSFRENMERISSEDVRQEVQRFWAILSDGRLPQQMQFLWDFTCVCWNVGINHSRRPKQ
jgi:hypothetical protein